MGAFRRSRTELTGAGLTGAGGFVPASTPIVISNNVGDASAGTPARSVAALGAAGVRDSCWLMDGATLEAVLFYLPIPPVWDTFDVFVRWAVPTANAGDAVWQAQYQFQGPGTTLGSETTGSQITATAAAQNVIVDTEVLSGISNAGGDQLRLEILRRGDVAGDTLNAVDIGLMSVYAVRVS